MSFEVSADAYGKLIGRYPEPLAVHFADLAKAGSGQRVLDVGCGPGALTAELVRRLGSASVCAVEPSASFAAAVRRRLPGVAVLRAVAERLPGPGPARVTWRRSSPRRGRRAAGPGAWRGLRAAAATAG